MLTVEPDQGWSGFVVGVTRIVSVSRAGTFKGLLWPGRAWEGREVEYTARSPSISHTHLSSFPINLSPVPSHLSLHASYSWRSPEGVLVVMRYVADAAGYRVTGGLVPEDTRGVAADGKQVFPRAADGSIILT
ncbi:hypothetical protein E2C01_005298 [Portunus trituberculatus]|uniref:Uncharacterized protein n=1 Tax=Portunus trituberculatus TaxID=210409 RepID=A0A5B7CTN5_PORTR|nr:hypothetical protein [Portunus trituberculatus]